MNAKIVPYEQLKDTDLVIDCIYKGGENKKIGAGNDPLSRLLNCSNQGGFRYRGSVKNMNFQLLIITSSLTEPDWPDYCDIENGRFIYYGDNRLPGNALHETRKKGNLVLKKIFDDIHTDNRMDIPPIFIFIKLPTGRNYVFKGLAAPGAEGLSQTEDLIAIWKSKKGQRFQNYKATFTILDIPIISREWIKDIIAGKCFTSNCPSAWKEFIENGTYKTLRSEPVSRIRLKSEQIPKSKKDLKIIKTITDFFRENPFGFEKCASAIAQLMEQNIVSYELTRPWRDGGRDAFGVFRIGLETNSINVEFALEAKLYSLKNSVGVKDTSRLVSRLRYRQFGIFVTSSFFSKQAYEEIIDDGHPVVLICANDIVNILKNAGYDTPEKVISWLKTKFS